MIHTLTSIWYHHISRAIRGQFSPRAAFVYVQLRSNTARLPSLWLARLSTGWYWLQLTLPPHFTTTYHNYLVSGVPTAGTSPEIMDIMVMWEPNAICTIPNSPFGKVAFPASPSLVGPHRLELWRLGNGIGWTDLGPSNHGEQRYQPDMEMSKVSKACNIL
jgi:hypothetical protein